MEESPNIQLRLVSSNPFIRPANHRDALVLFISTHDYFLKKAYYKGHLHRANTTPHLRKLRTLNV